MRIDRAAWPFVVAAAAPAAALLMAGWTGSGIAALVFPVAIALFFRDPERSPPAEPGVVVAPADGRVIFAGEARPEEAPPGAWRQITIFLSVLDVHINRAPVGGIVTKITYVPGSFRPAYRHDAHRNEHTEIWLDADGTTVVARQVVGLLARRIVCRLTDGERIARGARIGLMKFGSRMDVFVPVTALLEIDTGAHVRAGETVIARLGKASS